MANAHLGTGRAAVTATALLFAAVTFIRQHGYCTVVAAQGSHRVNTLL